MTYPRIRLLDLSLKNDDSENKLTTFNYNGTNDFIPFEVVSQYNLSVVRFSTSIREMPIWINDGEDYIEYEYLKGTERLYSKTYFDTSIVIKNYHNFLRVLNNTIYKSYVGLLDQMYPDSKAISTSTDQIFNLENNWTTDVNLMLPVTLANASSYVPYYLDIEIVSMSDNEVPVDIIFIAPGAVVENQKKFLILAKNVIFRKNQKILFTDSSLNNIMDVEDHYFKHTEYRPIEAFYNFFNRNGWEDTKYSSIQIIPTDHHSVLHYNIFGKLKCVNPNIMSSLSPIYNINLTNSSFVYDVGELFVSSGIQLKCNKRLLTAIQLDDTSSKLDEIVHYPDLTFSSEKTYIKIEALNNRCLNVIQYKRLIITSSDLNIIHQENNISLRQNIITDYMLPIQLQGNDSIIFNVVNNWRKFTLKAQSTRNIEFKMFLEYKNGQTRQIEIGNNESSDLMVLFQRDNGV
jgi:hypothetical protein